MSMDNIIFEVMNGMAIGRSNSHAKITQAPNPEPTLIEEWWVPQGQAVKVSGNIVLIHPSDMLDLRYPNRHPRYTLGHAEVRREQRKQKHRRKHGI